MAKTIVSCLILSFSILSFGVYACGTEALRQQATSKLIKNQKFRNFTCGNNSCDSVVMESYLDFKVVDLPGEPGKICIVQTNASVKNRYIGIFTYDKVGIDLQLVVFGNDVKGSISKSGHVMLNVHDIEDGSDDSGDVNSYEWNGRNFD